MQSLKPAELKSIEQFFQLRQESLLKVMYKYLKSRYEKVYFSKDYIIAVGDIPVALVAHLDTVFHTPPEDIFYDRVKNVMWSPDGLGADDRAGVYSIVQILKQGFKPTVIFTTDEETGAVGAAAITKDFPKAPVDLKYIIELDRRGSIDCVFYECDNTKFEEYVENFGFVTSWGTFSDISVICPAWEIAGVNLSIGYESEHSYSELLYVGHMQATIKKVIKMLQDASNIEETFKYIPFVYNSKFLSKYYNTTPENDYDGWDPSYGISRQTWKAWHSSSDVILECQTCGIADYDYNLFPVKGLDGLTHHLCCDCAGNDPSISWCKVCKEAFIATADDKTRDLCYDCKDKEEEKSK